MKLSLSRTSPKYRFVESLRANLSQITARNIEIKQDLDESTYFLRDPVFDCIQAANTQQDRRDYRCGITVSPTAGLVRIGFELSYSKTLLGLFAENCEQSVLEKVVSQFAELRQSELGYICWSSKLKRRQCTTDAFARKRENFSFEAEFASLGDLRKQVENVGVLEPWPEDFGCNPPPTGKGLRATIKGAEFLLLGGFNKSDAHEALKVLKPLFLSLYPTTSSEVRNSNLRRALLTYFRQNAIEPQCAWKGCKVRHLADLDAAHIKPHSKGGIDRFSNGIFLCRPHHRKQEGLRYSQQLRFLKQTVIAHSVLRSHL